MKDAPTELEPDTDEQEPEEESGKMSFLEHLDELRKRLLHIVAYIGLGFVASFLFVKQIYHFISLPITKALPAGLKLAYTNPTDPFTVYMKVAFIAGIFLTIPFSLYEVWKFIAPGLYRKEKKYVVPFLVSSVFLFFLGGAFCYLIVLPQMYGFLIGLGSDFTPVIKIDEYLDLTNMMLLGFGLIFEMPVIVAFLSLFGLVSAHFLWSKFKYSIVIIVTLAAIISPTGDAFNLMIWSAPMILLYIVSIGVAAIFGWRRKKQGLA
ncbi:MAG TPA: twin-arginine translocase subunit TatC [Acidobacteriota bacterium]|nr:twin-arginine translocase subunit TatC [Acidobacteriota bacterium]